MKVVKKDCDFRQHAGNYIKQWKVDRNPRVGSGGSHMVLFILLWNIRVFAVGHFYIFNSLLTFVLPLLKTCI